MQSDLLHAGILHVACMLSPGLAKAMSVCNCCSFCHGFRKSNATTGAYPHPFGAEDGGPAATAGPSTTTMGPPAANPFSMGAYGPAAPWQDRSSSMTLAAELLGVPSVSNGFTAKVGPHMLCVVLTQAVCLPAALQPHAESVHSIYGVDCCRT